MGIYDDEQNGEDEEDASQSLPTPIEAETDGNESQEEEEETEGRLPTPANAEDEDEDPALRHYNPQQNPAKRRQIRTSYRTLQRELDGKTLDSHAVATTNAHR